MLTNAVLRMLHTYIVVHYTIERGIPTEDVAPRDRGWGNTTEVVSTMIMPDKRNCQLSSPGDNEVLPVCIEIKSHCVFTTKVEQTFLRE